MANAIWIIEESKNGRYWHFYSAEDDIDSPSDMEERLKGIASAVNQFRGVQYVRDETTIVDRPRMPSDPHLVGRDCASMDAIKGNHCQHYHQGGTCCDCGSKATLCKCHKDGTLSIDCPMHESSVRQSIEMLGL